jgi:YihY family inner membrane protein
MIASLFVFGAFAFRTLREALTVIFDTPRTQRRRGIASRLAPLSYVALVGAGILVSSLLLTVLDTLPPQGLDLFGLQWGFRPTLRSLIRLLSLVVLVLLFASFYRFLAPERQSFRLSVVGGLFAVSIWEVARLLVLFYFTHLSTVGVVYGSLASIIVLLVSLDIAALAVLLGGQLIAEVARSHRAQLPWHTEPPSMSEAASGADEKEV